MAKLTEVEWRAALDVAVLKELTAHHSVMTYVVRNAIRSERRDWTWVETPNVLRSLRRLERRGLVEQARSNYMVQLCWKITAAGRAALNPEPSHD